MRNYNHSMVKSGISSRIRSNSRETCVAWARNVPCAQDFSVA